jgi:hypothetical protein
MGELIDFVLACILIFYVLRMIFRFLAPMLFQGAVNRAQQHFEQNQQQYHTNTGQRQSYNRTSAPDDKVKVDYVPPQKKKKGSVPDSAGDFIDFEEVK